MPSSAQKTVVERYPIGLEVSLQTPLIYEIADHGDSVIVTGNVRDIAPSELVLDNFRIVTPGDWLKKE